MKLVQEYDFVVLAKEMKILGAEAAQHLASSKDVATNKSELDYISSDMSIVLILEKVGAIQEMALLLGPNTTSEAKQYAPHTLRARLSDPAAPLFKNLVYSSESHTSSQRDISLFFPKPLKLERTLAIIKPDLVQHNKPEQIIELIKAAGFVILSQQQIYMSQLRAEQFYSYLKNDATLFKETTEYMSSGPSIVMILSKPGAIDSWLKLIGPSDPFVARSEKPLSLHAKLGSTRIQNGIYGSENEEQARKDIEEFFPNTALEVIPGLQELHDILSHKPTAPVRSDQGNFATPPSTKSIYETLIEGLTELCRVKPTGDEAVLYLADWLLAHNPNKPKVEFPPDEEEEVAAAAVSASSSSSSK